MRRADGQRIARYTKQNKKRSVWRKLVRAMACVVVFCTTYALILPAITAEQSYFCGRDAHTHGTDCYTRNVLTEYLCDTPEGAIHVHDEFCQDGTGNLVCTLPELEAHAHSELCYSEDGQTLLCTLEERIAHIHTDTCRDYFGTLICGRSEVAVHQHTADCIRTTETQQLRCGITEHTHDESCKSNPEADLETADDWESTLDHVVLTGDWSADLAAIAKTQIGYRESEQNFLCEDGQTRKGYTRYGAWYGTPYGSWNGLFVSFCLNYAQIPQNVISRESDPAQWLNAMNSGEWFLSSGVPGTGDPVFFHDEAGAVRGAIVTGVSDTTLQIVEGAYEGQVVQRELDLTALLGYCSLAAAQTGQIPAGDPVISRDELIQSGGEPGLLAQTATVTLNFTSWSQWNSIDFPGGNTYTCPVGSTITIRIGGTQANYNAPTVTVTGGTLISTDYDCDTAGCTHGWCPANPVHTFVIRADSAAVNITGVVQGGEWTSNSVTISDSGSTEPTPTEPTDPTEVTEPAVPSVPTYPYHPHAVHTGTVDISRLRFYNLCENGENGVSALAGCVFEITGENGYTATVISGDDPEVNLPSDIPDGTYTITEVSVPAGYMRDTRYERSFTIQNGMLVSSNNIGTFINHDLEQLESGKSAEVEDYNNRIYQVLLFAESHMRMYEMDPVDVLFVVDQSNSMLFPSGLKETGKSVTLQLDGSNNVANMEALNLDKNQMYYIISDPQGTSTVWCIWYNGQSWMYQDASYYAKAKHNNAPGYQDDTETAIFPQNRSYADQANAEGENERSNGGGLGFSLSGSGLGKHLDTAANDTITYQIYTATDEYNRLHYLEEALSNMIYELADANSENTVTLTRFTKEVDTDDCMGPLKLTPDNADLLVDEVNSINTSGGTRQDIALKHIYQEHLNNTGMHYDKDVEHTLTILITDGAPVLSSGSELQNLGSASDAPTTTGDTVYGQIKGYAALVRDKSTLMTVGLGMDNVEAGKDVLEQIASDGDHFCALDDAAHLVKEMQQMLFETFRPKELIEITGDIVDEISDSFYPIAWTDKGAGAATGRKLLVQDETRDWILLNENDWITLDGKYTVAGAADAQGQLLKKADGTYYIRWLNQKLSDDHVNDLVRIAWVNAGSGASSGRTVIHSDGTRDWVLLNAGDWITQQGEYYPGTPSYWNRRNYGQITQTDGVYSVEWGSSANANNRLYYTSDVQWEGTFYVKAKEDFIGGNAIDTNKSAYVTAEHANKYFDTPTVNVRLLGMNEFSSEVTVYLGDLINEAEHAPIDSLKGFYEDIAFTKLISDGGDVLNKITAASDAADGLEDAIFYLRYAMGRDLTDDEWTALMNGQTITIPYAYDNPSSHGAVGEFTFRLEKTGVEGSNPDYNVHEATAACQPGGTPLTGQCDNPVEKYTLDVTYTAYELGEKGRPNSNVHNGTGSPGTEVGTGSALETGLGVVESENIHEVHVISGAIRIIKRIESDLVMETDQTYTFILHRVEDGEDTSRDVTKTITVPANGSSGSIVFDGLRRGTYTVKEAVSDVYTLKNITVLSTTNCQSDPAINQSAPEVTFVMGNNVSGSNVIGKFQTSDAYTSYIDPVNGVFGEAEFLNGKRVYSDEIPVLKVWDDGAENHPGDAVYLVLYEGGSPVLDQDGNARILRLDAASNWTGSFEVPLKDKDDTLANYDYSVREVSKVSAESVYEWHSAVLENDGTVLYYEKVLESGMQFGVNSHGYIVEYTLGEDGLWTVTNHRTMELPMTGGPGTTFHHTFGGLLILAAALMYIRITGRNRRKEGR